MKNDLIIQEDIAKILKTDIKWQQFKNKTVLITGANGFLPAYLVETLLTLNDTDKGSNIQVVALVRNIEKAQKRFTRYLSNPFLTFVEQDVAEFVQYKHKINFIIHAASQASPKYYGIDPVGTLKANTIGTANLLELGRQHEVESFLYFSSSEVYGALEDKFIPTSENNFGYIDPTQIRSCYAESKRMGENMCVSWLSQYNVPVKIVRPFHTYGPGMALDDGRVYADFVADVINNRNIVMKSDGSARRAFCYLADAVVGFFTVLLNGENGQAYNIGNPDCEYSILEIAKIVSNLYPERSIKVIEKIPDVLDKNYLHSTVNRIIPDITKARQIGWSPLTDIETGFKRTINSYI